MGDEQLTNALNPPSVVQLTYTTMQINPEDYLPVDDYVLRGPSALQAPSQPASPVSQEPASLDSVHQALMAAERRGDYGQVGILSAQLDDLLSQVPTTAPSSSQEPSQEPSGTTQEASTQEEVDASYNASEVKQALNGTHGAEEVNRVHAWCNDNLSDEDLSEYLGLIQSDDQEALVAFQSLQKLASNAHYAPESEGVEYESFSDEGVNTLISNYGDHGETMVRLNQQFLAGQITQQQMQRAVLSDPMLAMSVFDAKSKGLITY